MGRSNDTSGQASAEYVALIALVALALTLAAGLTSGGIGGRVLAGLQRGICHVAHRACPPPGAVGPDLAPCPLERSERDERLSETIALVRLGTSGTLGATRSSDGRVTVTLANGSTVGGELGVGARLSIGRRALGGGSRAIVSATWSAGRSWTFADAVGAERFIARFGGKATIGGKLLDEVRSRCSLLCDAIGWRPHPRLPPPDERFEEGGVSAALAGALGIGASAASIDGEASAVLGRRLRRDGSSTWYVRLDASVASGLGLPSAELEGGGEALLSYDVDAHGMASSLGVHLAGRMGMAGKVKLGPEGAGAGLGASVLGEVDATLDLHDSATRAAAGALLSALAHRRLLATAPMRARALGERFLSQGQIDVRTYAVNRSSFALGAKVGLGIELGAGFDRAVQGLRLLSARTRLPGLPFLPRDDCRSA